MILVQHVILKFRYFSMLKKIIYLYIENGLDQAENYLLLQRNLIEDRLAGNVSKRMNSLRIEHLFIQLKVSVVCAHVHSPHYHHHRPC